MAGFDPGQRRAMLEAHYRAFNRRDMDGFLEHVAPGVDWPNESDGSRLYGRDAVRDYWQRQWEHVDPRVEPMRINFDAGGTAHVVVDQLIRDHDGKILQNRQVEHVYDFDGSLIVRMTIVELAQGEVDGDDGDGEDDGYGGADEGGPGGGEGEGGPGGE